MTHKGGISVAVAVVSALCTGVTIVRWSSTRVRAGVVWDFDGSVVERSGGRRRSGKGGGDRRPKQVAMRRVADAEPGERWSGWWEGPRRTGTSIPYISGDVTKREVLAARETAYSATPSASTSRCDGTLEQA